MPDVTPSASLFRTLSAGLQQAGEEEAVLRFWKEKRIFLRAVEEREGDPPFVFYEGPPTTNGRPGVHHVLSRTVKDLVCRFWTMQGRQVRRKGGWDTHGLPVEIEVEKELGIEGKEQIEAYGVAEFNARCRQSVFKYKDEWDRITERIGFWLDLEHPYVTLENDYIETVWWCLKRFWDAGNFYSGFKVVPYCPRCQTALSDHEVSQGYKDVTDPSVTVRFRMEDDPKVSILAWTTTPWTLPGNVALAVGEDIPYVRARRGDEELILAKDRLFLLGEDARVVDTFPGRDLVGKRYRPLFEGLDLESLTGRKAYYVAPADFVTTEEGTGVVHTAVMYGADDYALGDALGLPKHHTVDRTGHFTPDVPGFAGRRVREVDREIVEHLRQKGLLFSTEDYSHSYPFCWRCDSALLYYATDSWYLRTTAFKERMLEENREIRWFPARTGTHRFGNWLENNVDWAISRDRYWGTPLPLWRCGDEACGKTICVGSRREIEERGGTVPEDLHRPHVDAVVLVCEACGGAMRRLPGVADVWFDSGSMPFAQWHYPFENEDIFRASFPADFICEGIDQSRGWFYSLLAISTQVTGQAPFRNVVANELILDEEGRKMSKRLGNTVDPWEVLEAEGADALRWYLISNSPPWVTTRFSRGGVTEAARKFFGTLRNVANFFSTYANIDEWRPGAAPPVGERPVLDRWILSRLDRASASMAEDLENYQLTRAARTLSTFVQDELSNWYVRRNRRRFWKGEKGPDKEAAYATLHEVLAVVARLLAPFAPFLAETLHRTLVVPVDPEAPESVHLARFPVPGSGRRDTSLDTEMESAMAVTELARAARTQAGLKVRLPLARLRVLGGSPPREEILEVVRDEINVKAVDFVDPEEALEYRLKPNFKKLGPRFGADAERVARAIRELSPDDVRSGSSRREWTVRPEGLEAVDVGAEEVDLEETSPAGWVVVEEGENRVALDTRMDEELEREGWIRELVHRLQNLRKEKDLNVTDRVRLALGADSPTAETLHRYRSLIENEVLAASFLVTDPAEGHPEWDVDGTRVTVDLEKSS